MFGISSILKPIMGIVNKLVGADKPAEPPKQERSAGIPADSKQIKSNTDMLTAPAMKIQEVDLPPEGEMYAENTTNATTSGTGTGPRRPAPSGGAPKGNA